jgi:hypothetical protein
MSDLNTKLDINVGGNFTRRLSDNSRSLQRFSQNGQRQLGMLSRSAMSVSNGINRMGNRYTAILTGAAGAGTVKMLVGLESQFTRLGIQANMTAEEVASLKKEIFETANMPDIRLGVDELLSAVSAIIEQTGDKDFVKENIRNIGLMARATGTAGADVGKTMAEFQKNGNMMAEGVLLAIDGFNQQGKAGAYTLENFAAMGPRLFAAYGAMRSPEIATFNKELGAAMQVIRAGTGTSEQATTAFERLLATFADVEKIKILQRGGIQVFDPEQLKKGRKELRPITDLMQEIVEITKGDITKLSRIFDAEALRAMNGLIKEFNLNGQITSLDKFMAIQADGTQTLNDSARAAATADAAIQSLKNAWQQFADDNLAEHIRDIADALNSLEPERLQEALNTAKQIAIVLAGIYAANKALRMGMAASRFVKAGRGGGMGGAAGGLSAATAMPVWVVNMPGGGMMPGGAAGKVGKGARTPGRFGLLRAAPNLKTIGMMGAGAMGTAGLAVGGAGLAGYGVGTGIYKGLLEDTKLADSIGAAIAKSLAFFGNDKAQAAVASRSRLEIELKGANASVRSIESNDMDISVDTGPVMQ